MWFRPPVFKGFLRRDQRKFSVVAGWRQQSLFSAFPYSVLKRSLYYIWIFRGSFWTHFVKLFQKNTFAVVKPRLEGRFLLYMITLRKSPSTIYVLGEPKKCPPECPILKVSVILSYYADRNGQLRSLGDRILTLHVLNKCNKKTWRFRQVRSYSKKLPII